MVVHHNVEGKLSWFAFDQNEKLFAYVTVQAKASLVYTSKFATLEVHNFHMESHKHFKFTG